MKDSVKLSELPMNTKLFIESSDYNVEIIDKYDFLLEIQTSWRDYISDIHTLYIAEPEILKLTPRSFLADLLERYEDDQYEDWAQDMYDDLEDSPIVAQFVEQFNKTASGRVTYYPGLLIEADMPLYNEDGSRIQNIVEGQML